MGRISESYRRRDLKILAIPAAVIGTIAGIVALIPNGPPYTVAVVVLYVVLLGTLGMGFVAFIALAILVDIVSDISKYLAGRRSRRRS